MLGLILCINSLTELSAAQAFVSDPCLNKVSSLSSCCEGLWLFLSLQCTELSSGICSCWKHYFSDVSSEPIHKTKEGPGWYLSCHPVPAPYSCEDWFWQFTKLQKIECQINILFHICKKLFIYKATNTIIIFLLYFEQIFRINHCSTTTNQGDARVLAASSGKIVILVRQNTRTLNFCVCESLQLCLRDFCLFSQVLILQMETQH